MGSKLFPMDLELKAKLDSVEEREDPFSKMYWSAYDEEFEWLYAKKAFERDNLDLSDENHKKNILKGLLNELHEEASERAASIVVREWFACFADVAAFPDTVMQEIQSYLHHSDMFTVHNEEELERSQVRSVANVYRHTMRDKEQHKTIDELLSSYENGTWVLLLFEREPIFGNRVGSAILKQIKLDWEGDFQIVTESSANFKGFNVMGTLRGGRNAKAQVKSEAMELEEQILKQAIARSLEGMDDTDMETEEQIVNQTIACSLGGMEDSGMSIEEQILAQAIAQSLEGKATAGHSMISLDDDSYDLKIPSINIPDSMEIEEQIFPQAVAHSLDDSHDMKKRFPDCSSLAESLRDVGCYNHPSDIEW